MNTITLILRLQICLLFVLAFSSCSPDNEYQTLIEELERDIPELMEKAMIPGSSIAVIKDGKIIWTNDFGVKNTETMEPISKNTVYPAASLTKPFFAYLAMKLVDNGELDLDKPLIEYIPLSKIENMLTHPINEEGFHKEWFNRITARMILSHTSGFSHGFMGVTIPYPLRFEPGIEYQYSGDGYGYLQTVVEHIRNESLETLMLGEVIEPLKMNNSSMIWQKRFKSNIAYGHDMCQTAQNELSKSHSACASASLYSTAEDYAKFILGILNGKDMKEKTIADFLSPQISIEEGVSWSSGFGIDSTEAGNLFWHTGDITTFRHFFIGSIDNKSGLVFMTNSQNGLRIVDDLGKKTFDMEDFQGISSQGYEDYNVPDFKIIHAITSIGKAQAIDVMNELVQSNPEEGENLIRGVGVSLMNCMKFDEAIEILREGIKTYPNSIRLYSAIASVSYRNGEYDQAIDNFQLALNIDKDNNAIRRYLKFVELTKMVLNKDIDSALTYYEKLIDEDPGQFNERNLSRYGNRLLRAGRAQASIGIFKVNLHFNKGSSNANLDLGDAYAMNNETESALMFIRKSLEISPGNQWAKSSLSKLEDNQ
jgi:CubicO group peptidase (beta-lactamase class C family)